MWWCWSQWDVRINNRMPTLSDGHSLSLFAFVLLGSRRCEGTENAVYSGFVFWATYFGTYHIEWWPFSLSEDLGTLDLSYNCFRTRATWFSKPTLFWKHIHWSLFIFLKSEEVRKPHILAPLSKNLYHGGFWMALTHVIISCLTTLPSKSYKIYIGSWFRYD